VSIRTVTGDVDAGEFGVTFAHEHLFMTGGWPVLKEPDYRLDSLDRAIEEVTPARELGLAAMVEMTPLGFGRDPEAMRELSVRTGVRIIACTGFHKSGYYDDLHWLHRYDVDTITDLLVGEVTEGMDIYGLVGPVIRRSSARAGVIKLAAEYHRFGRGVRRLVAAVAAASLRTGAPIATHCDKGTMADELLDAFAAEGVGAGSVVLGHIDHNPDPPHLAELAARGAFLCFDLPGRVKYGPDSQIVDLLAGLAGAGHAGQVLLGSDLARRSYWRSLGGGPGLTYLLDRFVPRLTAAGLGELAAAALGDNAQRAFSLR
jgi:predicted metal-dependent phosphotriesterase family hydrolase